jgi:thiamine-phosphate pyrophosphorylase
MTLNPLYAIVDAEVLAARGVALVDFARELRAAGVGLVQYRDKNGSPQEVLRGAAILREAMAGSGCKLIMNDRADLAVLAGFDGVHVGQGDLSPEDAKAVVRGAVPSHRYEQVQDSDPTSQNRDVGHPIIVGVSTHTEEQVRVADQTCADYVAIGPVFATGTKLDASPVVGLEGVRRARALTRKPLVAIGGITRANARSVVNAGADSIAVISALFAPDESVEQVARDFLAILR